MARRPENQPQLPLIIRRPTDEDLLEKLGRKRQEYQDRLIALGEHKHPQHLLFEGLASGSKVALDSMLKLRLLGQVLDTGEANSQDFSEAVINDPLFDVVYEVDPGFLEDRIKTACGIIDGYCRNGTSQMRGGNRPKIARQNISVCVIIKEA